MTDTHTDRDRQRERTDMRLTTRGWVVVLTAGFLIGMATANWGWY